jgi:hypothetical protein
VKLVPENKTFLVVALVAILILAGIKYLANGSGETTTVVPGIRGKNFNELFEMVKREKVIRARHTSLTKASEEWEKVFLHGDRLEACLALLKYTGEWVKASGMKNEATRMLMDIPEKGGFTMVGLELRGSSSFITIRDFLACVERAPIVMTVEYLHLEKTKEDKAVRFQIRLVAPTLHKKGVAKP